MEGGLNTYSRSAPSPGSSRAEAPTPAWYSLVTLTLAAGLVAGCAAPIQYARPIHEDTARAVFLEARYGYGQEGKAFRFSHPLVLTEGQWDRILGSVRISPRNWMIQIGGRQGAPGAAFRDDERAYLATQLATAFAGARPDEWVLFYLSRPIESGLQEITSGGFFVEGARLHVVLANYRLPASMPHVAAEVRQDPLRPLGDTYYSLAPGEHQEVGTYLDWRWTKPLLEHPMELVCDLDAILGGSEPPQSEAAGPPRAVDQVEAPDLEGRFHTLERLRERGFITEQEYQRKRKQLLEGL